MMKNVNHKIADRFSEMYSTKAFLPHVECNLLERIEVDTWDMIDDMLHDTYYTITRDMKSLISLSLTKW